MTTWLYVGKVIQDRLFRRFRLRDHPVIPDPLYFNKIILPITNIDELLKDPVYFDSGPIATSGAGGYKMYTVPAGIRAKLLSLSTKRTSGNFTFNGIYVVDADDNIGVAIDAFTAVPLNAKQSPLYQAIPMKERWYIQVNVDTVTVDGNLEIEAVFEYEDAYQ